MNVGPEYDDNHARAQELTEGVTQILANAHPHDVMTVGIVDSTELVAHLTFSTEGLDNTQAAQRLLHYSHCVAPQRLSFNALGFQLTPYPTHEPANERNDDDGEQRQLPRNENQRYKVGDNEDWVFEHQVEARHDAVLHLLYVARHTGYNVTLTLLSEEA